MADKDLGTLACDLDGTLALKQHPFNPYTVGEPVPTMLQRVKDEIAKGRRVVLFTARAASQDPGMHRTIREWLTKHGLDGMKITNQKTPDITELLDDRAKQVVPDTGKIVGEKSALDIRQVVKRATELLSKKQASKATFKDALKSEENVPRDMPFYIKDDHCIVNAGDWHEKEVIDAAEALAKKHFSQVSVEDECGRPDGYSVVQSDHEIKQASGSKLQRLWERRGQCPECGGKPEDYSGTKTRCKDCRCVFTPGEEKTAGANPCATQPVAEPPPIPTPGVRRWGASNPVRVSPGAPAKLPDIMLPSSQYTPPPVPLPEIAPVPPAPVVVAAPAIKSSAKAPTKFYKPENHDPVSNLKLNNCTMYAGVNDWEEGTTWLWIVQQDSSDLEGKIVWISVKQPDDLDPAGDLTSEQCARLKAHGIKARAAWFNAAKGKTEFTPGPEQFEEALSDDSMDPYVQASGVLHATAVPREKRAAVFSSPPDNSGRGPRAILEALKNVDMDALRAKAMADIKSGKVTRRDRGVKMLNVLEGLKRNDIKPEELMISRVPVLPPEFRPFSMMGTTFVPGNANELYQDLFRHRDIHKETLRDLGEGGAALTRRNMLGAVRALYGYGDPVSPKLQARATKGYLHQVLGDSPKTSFVQRKLIAKPIDSVGRGVITVNPDLDMNEISLPENMAWDMYGSHVQRRLVNSSGMKPVESLRALKERTREARVALDQELKERPVIYSRAPSWHKFNTIAGWARLHEGDNIAINPYVTSGLNADFNGDSQVGKVLVLLTSEFVRSNPHLDLQSHIGAVMAQAMTNKNIIPAFNAASHQLHLVDLQDFPRGELRGTNPKGKNGPIHFYDVPLGTQVVAFDESTGNVEWKTVSSYSIHPQRSIELVDLSNGRQITTDDDPRAVYGIDPSDPEAKLDRFSPAEALRRKVLVPCVRDVAAACNHLGAMTEVDIAGDDGVVVRSQPLNWDFGYLLGALAGDGWWDKKEYGQAKAVYLSDLKEFNAFRVFNILRDMFGSVSWDRQPFTKAELPDRYGDTIRHTYRFKQGSAFAEFLLRWLGGLKSVNSTGSATKCLPDFFLLAPREFREGLLNGMVDTDGSISASNGKGKPQLLCAVTSTSLRLITDVKFLCLTLGIQASVGFSKTTSRDNTSWICSISSVDIKRTPMFNNLACPWKRDAYLNTEVCADNTSLVFDKVPVPTNVFDLVMCELESPKIRTHEREDAANHPDLAARKESQNYYVQWWNAKTTKLVSRDFAVRVAERLHSLEQARVALRLRAIEDLRTNDVVTPERVALWREAIRVTAPPHDTPDRFKRGQGIRSRLNRPLKTGRTTAELRDGVRVWLETFPPYQCAADSDLFKAWYTRFVVPAGIGWAVVTGVQKTGIKEDGYDLTVPGFETFMSADGVILSNTINVNVPILHESVQEAITKLMPDKMKFSIRDHDTAMAQPKHEQVLGLWTASSRPSGKVFKYGSKQQAVAAINNGDVNYDDDVEFPDP